ncbi:hypothetical protein [Pseudonocardia dioxanivorans]|uniref:hypothetical protein n=1 Tax=Pseudonocardia dioxanivorans TaxID=240495 RepID=UPI001044B5A2|nr:hypothetical protein [Pseudonocardia dioxanivorans]
MDPIQSLLVQAALARGPQRAALFARLAAARRQEMQATARPASAQPAATPRPAQPKPLDRTRAAAARYLETVARGAVIARAVQPVTSAQPPASAASPAPMDGRFPGVSHIAPADAAGNRSDCASNRGGLPDLVAPGDEGTGWFPAIVAAEQVRAALGDPESDTPSPVHVRTDGWFPGL